MQPNDDNGAGFIPVDIDKEIRCPFCHRLHAKGDFPDKGQEIKCQRCKKTFRIMRAN